jgi:hypothetical protein
MTDRTENQRLYRFKWRHGPSPGLTYYEGTEAAWGPDQDTARERALREICRRGCFSRGCIKMELDQ